MKLEKLKNLKQFQKLKRGQQILVEWSDYFVKHHDNADKNMLYKIYKHKKEQTEIICQLKGNHYFNYNMFLGLDTPSINTSQALNVYLVV